MVCIYIWHKLKHKKVIILFIKWYLLHFLILCVFSLQLWDSQTFKPLTVYKGHTSWVLSVSFDSSGKRLLSASDDGTVMIWKGIDKQDEQAVVLKREFDVQFGGDDLPTVVASDIQNRCLVSLHSFLTSEMPVFRKFPDLRTFCTEGFGQ